MSRLLAAFLAALILLSVSACGASEPEQEAQEQPAQKTEEPVEKPEPTPEELSAQRIDALLSSMSLEEKVGQLFFVRCPAENAVEDVGTYHLGGYLLFGRDFKDKTANEIIQTIASYQDASRTPMLIGVDEEGGTVVRVSSNPNLRSSKFASPQKLFASGGMDEILENTKEKDRLLSALGINVNFAPVADLSTNASDFIYSRSFGQDAAATGEYVSSVVFQMSSDNMGSVLKHFPGYGNNVDTHTGIALDERPYEQFLNEDFDPFRAGITSGRTEAGQQTTSVLVSHNIVTCMDPDLPASLSPEAHRILREELGFDGVVMTDDLAMDAVAAYAEDGAVAVMSLAAGNDIVLTTDYRTQIPKVIEAVESGALSEEIINIACYRVLKWKDALGLF